MATLLAEPRWAEAAQALVHGCVDLREDDERVALLAAVCGGLGDELYPAFIELLAVIGRHGEHAACAAVADTLVHALRTGRLPSGRRRAWGLGAQGAAAAFGSTRTLGPIEYLCAWHAQGEGDGALPRATFETFAVATLELLATGRDARSLYCQKLLADAEDPLPGALNRSTRHALRELAVAWSGGAVAADAVARFVGALPSSGGRGLGALGLPPAFATR